MLITVLGSGTSQGVPVIGCQCPVCQSTDPRDKRTRTSLLIRTDQVTVAVDAGPDFRQQMLREGISRLDAVFITHEHKDHIGGLDDVRPFIFNQDNRPMPLFVSETALPEIKREFSYAFSDHLYPGAPTYEVHLIDETPFTFGDLYVEPIRLKHFTLTSYAFRIGRFAYVTDFNEISDAALARLQGVEYMVIEALGRRNHYSHINLKQAVQIATDLGVRKAWFTHCSHHIGKAVDVNAELPDNMMLAYDGLSFEV
ncbi:MAG: MBL fold metallo-hydrolase [Bacteroidales bacterium]|nr:MBL fold metallo-hydrolase [Bacteroidales bacterium]